ncbi:ribosomal s subunit [Holotrichia oblita]|uniref:Ribosomal s subunit n=2 Tax=Holotrichia oblita TaxID=644536 RepID=A0ACB9TM85_HOLOL|nr:ribosomal s subunit [Holotrichia oblita]
MGTHILNITKSLQKLTINSRYKIKSTYPVNTYLPLSCEIVFSNTIRNSANFFGKRMNIKLKQNSTMLSLLYLGKANIVWPGLSAPIIRGKELVEQQKLPEDPDREKKLVQLRDTMGTFKFAKLSPLDRGWTGAKMPGRSIGPPDPIGEDKFDGFDTRVLELKTVFNMKGNFGRKRRLSVFVVTGNSNGLAGFATGKGLESKIALRKAKNRAGQKLMHIKIFRDHTVYHDFFTQFGSTKIYVSQRPPGHGLVCHRAIKTICNVVGIKDLYAKVEGSTNLQHVVKAFFLGLLKQKTHQEIAEEKKLHLVELTKETSNFPNVLASPTKCRETKDVSNDEILNFTQYALGGRVVYRKRREAPFFTKLKSWEMYLKKQEKLRGQKQVRINMLAEYGELRSFLTEKYPECRPAKKPPKEQQEES